jgi:hypothetical protein
MLKNVVNSPVSSIIGGLGGFQLIEKGISNHDYLSIIVGCISVLFGFLSNENKR